MPILKGDSGEKSISLYNGVEASPQEVAIAMSRLKTGFPKMENAFFNLLAERVIGNGFSENRLKDAINEVLDNFRYKELTIADIIKFDKRVKLYSYNEVCALVSKGTASFSDFETREINGEYYRIKKTDLTQFLVTGESRR